MKSFKRFIAILLTLAAVLSVVPMTAFASDVPQTVAESAVLINADTGRVLYEKNDRQKMYPASMTKMLTAMVVLDNMESNDTIKVDSSTNEVPWDSSKAGLKVGEVLTVENAIRGLIIPSGNDVATVVASAVAKKALGDDITYTKAEEYFTGLMNEKAKSLGCTDSNFVNPHGYHNDNHYTTAYDLSLIAQAAMKYDSIKEIAAETSFSGNGAGKQKYNVDGTTSEYTWNSHNELITNGANYYECATGIKTGFTDEAGDCVAASATNGNENLIAVIMNSEDPGRWNDAKALFDWAFQNYDITEYRQAGVAATAKLTGHNRLNGDTLDLTIENSMSEYLTADEAARIEAKVVYDDGGEFLKAPVDQGEKVGKLQFLLDGKVIGEADAYASKAVGKSNIFNLGIYYIKTFFGAAFARENIKYTAGVLALIIIIIIIIIIRHRRKRRYRIKGNYSNRGIYDTSRVNSKKRRKSSHSKDKYNRFK
ncbi:MAG: D-alanyl-D-alanine carboxypeptidase family protein [Candidatus Metalachnospira sp.]|nr:D-alanyl-D-alanine carboxypeptidase family protein [Candidatus Metalachnospira sp.]